VGFNLRRPLFADVRVRHAIDLLMPRAEIEKVQGGVEYYPPCSGSFLPNSPEYDPSVLPTPYDPVLAAQLLDEAGWKLSPRDGFRYREGKKLQFTLLYDTGGNHVPEEMIQESLQKAGILVSLEGMDAPRLSDTLNHWNFDAYLWGWSSALDDDPFPLWHSSQAMIQGSANNVGYESKEADRLMEAADVEFDPVKRDALFHQLQRVIHDDYPVCFLGAPSVIMLISKRVHDVHAEEIGYLPFLGRAYVPRNQQKHPDP
jgi:peptide/nickel transport system substrate-binding protein